MTCIVVLCQTCLYSARKHAKGAHYCWAIGVERCIINFLSDSNCCDLADRNITCVPGDPVLVLVYNLKSLALGTSHNHFNLWNIPLSLLSNFFFQMRIIEGLCYTSQHCARQSGSKTLPEPGMNKIYYAISVVTPLLMYWCYCSLAINHWYGITIPQWVNVSWLFNNDDMSNGLSRNIFMYISGFHLGMILLWGLPVFAQYFFKHHCKLEFPLGNLLYFV